MLNFVVLSVIILNVVASICQRRKKGFITSSAGRPLGVYDLLDGHLLLCANVIKLKVNHLKADSLWEAPALLASIRVGWNGLPGTNTLAYYEHLTITSIKSFIRFGPGANVIKLFCP